MFVNDCEGDYVGARAEEMAWYEKFKAYEEVTGETCVSRTGHKAISCRWRDINKGDNERVEYEADLSHVKSNRKGQTATSQEHHRQHSYVT